jgi:hypothetical protein
VRGTSENCPHLISHQTTTSRCSSHPRPPWGSGPPSTIMRRISRRWVRRCRSLSSMPRSGTSAVIREHFKQQPLGESLSRRWFGTEPAAPSEDPPARPHAGRIHQEFRGFLSCHKWRQCAGHFHRLAGSTASGSLVGEADHGTHPSRQGYEFHRIGHWRVS